jgi:23S rRNA (cytosine1962-C5)-methyltransferase
VEGYYKPGDAVNVVDPTGKFLGRGFISPDSAIMVRILSRREGRQLDESFLRSRLETAVQMRRLLGLPGGETDGYRLVNSEGDGLGGLVVDAYGETLVVQVLTVGMKKREEQIYGILQEVAPCSRIYELGPARHQRQEGIRTSTRVVRGTRGDVASFRESGLGYEVSIPDSQKTGFYFDQRENRRLAAAYASGAEVLDLYSYTASFSMHCVQAGAARVTAVDSSMKALLAAERNLDLNGLKGRVQVVCQDAQSFLTEAVAERRRWDLVIADPPNFAHSARDRDAGGRAYRRLNALAMECVGEGRILATACCSGQFPVKDYLRVLGLAARDAGVRARVLDVRGAAPDHPSLPAFEQGRYLKFVLMEIRNVEGGG